MPACNTVLTVAENEALKRDVEAQDRDVWFSVSDETETETFPDFLETERFQKASRD